MQTGGAGRCVRSSESEPGWLCFKYIRVLVTASGILCHPRTTKQAYFSLPKASSFGFTVGMGLPERQNSGGREGRGGKDEEEGEREGEGERGI